MTNSVEKERTPAIQKYVWAVGISAACTFLALLIGYWRVTIQGFTVDNTVLTLVLGMIGGLLLPLLSRLKIGDLLELELRHLGTEIRKVKETLLRGEVVRDECDKRFYIDDTGARHSIPDDQTARFLRSSKGEIPVSTDDLEPYPPTDPMDSVLGRKPLYYEPHIFAVLNGKRYHATVDDIVDWGFPHEADWQKVDERELTRYPRGR